MKDGRVRAARRGVIVAAVVGLVGLSVQVGFAAAAPTDQTAPLQILGVDARGGDVTVDYLSTGEPADEVTLEIDGETHAVTPEPLRAAGVEPGVSVVLDNSAGMANASLRIAMEDMEALAPTEDGIAFLGAVTTANGARLVGKPATTYAAASANFGPVRVGGTNSLWDGIKIAVDSQTGASTRKHVVAVVASADSSSSESFSAVARLLREENVAVHVIALAGSMADGLALNDLVTSVGGSMIVGTDDELGDMFTSVASLIKNERRATVTDVAGVDTELGSLRLTVGEHSVIGAYRPGVLAVGREAVRATPVQAGAGEGFLASDAMKYVIIAFGALAAGGAVFAGGLLITKRRDGLNYALRYYDESYEGTAASGSGIDDGAMSSAAILQRAVDVTESLAERRGILERVERLLERADLPLRPAEALMFYVGIATAALLGAIFVTRNLMYAVMVLLLACAAPGFIVDFMAKRRKKKFNALLPDMLQLLAGTLRAGYSIGQGIEAVSSEIDEPMAKELGRAVTEARLGRPLDEALESVAVRMDSDDFGWAVMAIRIQREVGGNLAELLMTVSDTMVQRERLRRDVASLTAEGRMSAIILGLLPPGLGVAMWVMNPTYISKLFSGMGLILLGASILMMVIGFFWMKKTITIEV